jgi:hypothetical protein
MRRREFVASVAAAGALAIPARAAQTPKGRRKRIAALSTTYHVRSHSDNFITRFLEGWWINDKYTPPPFDVVSLYMDQVHPADIGHRLASAYGFPVTKTIEEALTLGTGKLAVDGVLLVAEHGDYPFNDRQQQLYPRFEFFREVTDVYKKSKRSAPVWVDKHLSWDWAKAKAMYDLSRELKFPLMAGSSVSVTFRRPELDPPLGVEFDGAVMVGGGWITDGGIFHNLETLQAFVERRKGGETGIRAVEYLKGPAVWKAAEEGRWSKELMQAALARGQQLEPGRPEDVKTPVACLLEYNDGFKASVVALGGLVNEYLVAYRRKGSKEIESTNCYVPKENSNNFSGLTDAIAHMIETGKLRYPVERTLLTTGALQQLMESAFQGGKRIETPLLKVKYTAPAKSYYMHGMGS